MKIRNKINVQNRNTMNQAQSTKLLAKELQKQQADDTIYKIRDPDSKRIQYKQDEIPKMFKKYYKLLYTQPRLEDELQIGKLFDFFF